MQIIVTSLFVEDQERALRFYTEVLGFAVKQNIPLGEFRWITLVSPADQNGVELILEPNVYPAAKAFQESMFADGIPATMFGVGDVRREFERLGARGVHFTVAPAEMDGSTIAVFDDTCGNLIQIMQK